jgi:hypothetical protein
MGRTAIGLVCWLIWVLAPAADVLHLRSNCVDVSVEVDSRKFRGGADPLLHWIERSVSIVSGYYGFFPTRSLHIRIDPEAGGGVQGGTTWGYGGGFIRARVGTNVTEAQLDDDWVLVHEMTHLALPDLGDRGNWLSEGLAVYIEGIARAQAGNRTAQDVFAEQMRQMPRGMPQPGDQGLDRTHSWGRTYWGGAMFCFLADVEIHRRTHNRFGLQDAMSAVARKSGGLASDWPITRVLATADEATGTTVLQDLYAQMADRPVAPDLHDLWARLGVISASGNIVFRDDAPLASLRKSILAPRVTVASCAR